MAVLLTADEKRLFEEAKEWAVSYIAPRAKQWDLNRKFPEELFQEAISKGYLCASTQKEYGGQGFNWLKTTLLYEALANGDGGAAFFIQLHSNIVYNLINYYRFNDTIKKLIPDMVAGKKLCCFALTEESGGTDPAGGTSYAELKEDGYYHVTGEKTWASNSVDAFHFVLSVNIKRETGNDMIMLLADRDMPGMEILEDRHRIAGNVMSCGTIRMTDVKIPADRLLADGYREVLKSIDVARIFVPAIAIGNAQRALDLTTAYLAKRESFGQPIIKSQGIQWRLADLSAELEAARWLCYHAASVMDSGDPVSILAAKNKLLGPDVGLKITLECAELMGALSTEFGADIDRCVNMARICRIVDGTTEVQRIVIGRSIERKFFPKKKK